MSTDNTSSLSVEVSVRLSNTDTLLDCESSSAYSGFGDPILRIRVACLPLIAATQLRLSFSADVWRMRTELTDFAQIHDR